MSKPFKVQKYQTCDVCYDQCPTKICLTAHKQLKSCKPKKLCDKCHKGIDPKLFDDETQSHPNCSLKYCDVCKSYKPPDHDFCYVSIYEAKKIGFDPEEVNDSSLPEPDDKK